MQCRSPDEVSRRRPPSQKLCAILVTHGHDAVHVSETSSGFDTPDTDVAAKADAEDRVVVSKDADFVNSQAVTGTPAKLLRIRVGNTSNRVLFALMEQLLDDITTGFDHAAHIELHDSMLVIHTK